VTGTGTGKRTNLEDLKVAKSAAGTTPVFVGSGVDNQNVAEILKIADGVIAGTSLKRDGITTNSIDAERVRLFMKAAR
jgi:predicted TIM-barrel enzyme